MHKLLFVLMVGLVASLLQMSQWDQQMAMRSLFTIKQAVNRAAHAAAQQVDDVRLSEGKLVIDPQRARDLAEQYLQWNLKLDTDNRALPDGYFKGQLHILDMQIIGEEAQFPYVYGSDEWDYEVTLRRPGVILIVELAYPRMFALMQPLTWQVKGAAELNIF